MPESEIAPQLLRHGQGHNRCGLSAQYPWTKACRLVAGGLGLIDFVIGQAALRADQERQTRGFCVAGQGLGHRVQHQLEVASVVLIQSLSNTGG